MSGGESGQPEPGFELDVDSVAFGGMGVGRDCGRVCFVPRTIAGERVRVRTKKRHKRFSECTLLDVLRPSSERIEPDCPLWNRGCNGCSYRHMSYAEQARTRREQIDGLLRHLGAVSDPPAIGFTGAKRLAGYRNSLTFHLIRSDDGTLRPAFKRADGTLLETDACLLGGEHIFAALPGVVAELESAFAGRHMPSSCTLTIKQDADSRTDFVLADSRQRVLMNGGRELEFRHGGRTLKFSAQTFFQTNPEILAKFLDYVRAQIEADCRAAGPGQETAFFDVYAGVGTVSAFVGDLAGSCVAIESFRPSVAFARRNLAGLENCSIVEGAAQKRFRPTFRRMAKDVNVVFINPPRTGCDPDMLRALRAEAGDMDALYYLCCEPSILSRDLKRLLADGVFEIESVHAFDMFVWTMHVETLVKLRGKKS